ncbi:S-layer domain-like protein [Acetivibrio thermocellus BC1]|nr:S-layer domain-like protein [Acetivibrio thermocellus BC1]
MSKIKIVNILILLVLLISFNLETVNVFAGPNDIIITKVVQKEENVSAGKSFKLEVYYKNVLGVPLKDVYISVDKSSSFYIDNDHYQTKYLKDMAVGDGEEPIILYLVYKGTGNELTLIFDYLKEGATDREQLSQTLFLSVKKEKEQTSGGSQTNTAEYKPNFRIVGKISSKQEGKNVSVEFPIKNVSNFTAKDIQITMSADSADSPFSAPMGHLSVSVDEIKPDAEKKIKLDLAVKPNTKSGIYPLKLEFKYGNLYGDSFSSSEVIYVDIENNDKSPSLILKGVEMLPQKPAPGDRFSASIELENLGTLGAKDVKVTLKGLTVDGIYSELVGVNYLKTIEGGRTGKLNFSLVASNKINVQSFPLEIAVDYKDEFGNSYAESFIYYVPIKQKSEGKASLKIDNITSPATVVAPDEDFKVGFDIVNDGTKELSDLKVSVTAENGIICKSQSITVVDSLKVGEKKSFEFLFTALTDAVTKNYPIAINVEYDDEGSSGGTKEKRTVTQYVGVYVENPKEEEKKENTSTPRLIIDRYSISTGQAIAGKSFEIELGILNTHKNMNVENIAVSFLADEGVFLPAAKSGSTIFIDQIKAGERVVKKMTFATKYDAVPKSYLLNINFEYEDEQNKAYTLKESISIPVIQEQRLEISEIQTGMDAVVGQPVSVNLNFYNMGKSTLNNLMVRCKGDFELQPGSEYFAGNFEPGRSDYYEAYIVPNKEGQVKGSIIFTFEDNNGEVKEIEKEFEIFVQGQPSVMKGDVTIVEPGMAEAGMKFGKAGFPVRRLLILAGVSVPVIAGVVVLIIILAKRKKARADLYENI